MGRILSSSAFLGVFVLVFVFVLVALTQADEASQWSLSGTTWELHGVSKTKRRVLVDNQWISAARAAFCASRRRASRWKMSVDEFLPLAIGSSDDGPRWCCVCSMTPF